MIGHLAKMQVNCATMAGWVFSTAGLALIGLSCAEVLTVPYSVLGMALVAFGCTARVVAGQQEMMKRERDAFDLGQEAASVRRLR